MCVCVYIRTIYIMHQTIPGFCVCVFLSGEMSNENGLKWNPGKC